jgi:Cu+-exporting ATPase
MLTGDHRAAALRVASQVGIHDRDVYSDLSPEDKLARVRSEQAAGAVVAMLGDGINDAAALATADLGIAMNSGSDAAINASDVTVVGRDLSAVPTAIRLARRTLATIKQNLWWAFGYNLVMLPLAIAGYLSPLLAGAAMAASSTIVVTNSLRLRHFQ